MGRKFLMAAALMVLSAVSALAAHVSDYEIDYKWQRATVVYQTVALPPVRFRHPPATDIPVEELQAEDIQTTCMDAGVWGCLITRTKNVAVPKHHAKVCSRAGLPAVCRYDTYVRGDEISSDQMIYVPKVGVEINGQAVTAELQAAILLHEIAHANGWGAAHER